MSDGEHKQALPAGYELQGYRLVRVLGVGGFGVTYLAEDVRLGRSVAIKEYLPNEFAVRAGETVHPKSRSDEEDFAWGLKRFLDEARTLARFRHPNLVQVLDYFEVNRTAYIVMNYEEGESLDRVLERRGTLSEAQLKRVLLPMVDGLKEVHAAGYLHRDIKPSNVFIRRADESPVLLDFGSARQALGRKSKSLTAVASAGYSPPEQYESEGEQGPSTDIYGLSALCYRAITGTAPMEAPRRMSQLIQRRPDPLPKLAEERREGYSAALLAAVDRGLRLAPSDRPPSLDGWVEQLTGTRPTAFPAGGAVARGADSGLGSRVPDGGAATRARRLWLGAGAATAVAVAMLLLWSASGPEGGGGESPEAVADRAPAAAASDETAAAAEADRLRAELEAAEAAARREAEARAAAEAQARREAEARASAEAAARRAAAELEATRKAASDARAAEAAAEARRAAAESSRRAASAGGADPVGRVPVGPAGMEFVWVPPGEFRMGSTSAGAVPLTQVRISEGFWLGKYEVTQSEWEAVMGSNPSRFGNCGGDCPVERVSWADVQGFLGMLNAREGREVYRLPREAEWEYAARAGTTGDRYGDLSAIAWHGGNSEGRTHPVGLKLPNGWGLYDMLGNVYEWVGDRYGGYPGVRVTDPGGPGSGSYRVYRGCGWLYSARSCRAPNRGYDLPGYRSTTLGFRLLRTR